MINVRKMRPEANLRWPSLRLKRGHAEARATFHGTDQNEFRVVLRRSAFNALAFSAVLMVRVPGSTRWFRLRRYNGNNHIHFNLLEGNRFRSFHIHTATERYQRRGGREDGYAEPTERFSSFDGAVQCLAEDAALQVPAGFDAIMRYGANE